MTVGDMVRSVNSGILTQSKRIGIIVDVIQKKCWRTEVHGPTIDWRKIDSEPHAIVMFNDNNDILTLPTIELEVVK